MAIKKIKTRKRFKSCPDSRDRIAKMQKILDKFATEDGFDEYCEKDSITIRIGDDAAETYFCPRTWEAAFQFIAYCICHLIVQEELDKFPMYADLLARYSAALNMERDEWYD